MKPHWLAVLIGGAVLLGMAHFFRYTVVRTHSESFSAVKLDRWTGKTWVLRGQIWKPMENETP